MFDGVDIRTQTNPEQAHYWGETVEVQGFFLNHVMNKWQDDVGVKLDSKVWQRAKRFQRLYSQTGVTDNFIKVAIWKAHDWQDSKANAAVVKHFSHAAALAKYAGFKGMAMDLEPYVSIWGGDAGSEKLAPTLYKEGKSIGLAMHRAYPKMTLVLIKDALYWASRRKGYHGGFGLAVPFLKGLLAAGFSRVVVASELTYKSPAIVNIQAMVLDEYGRFLRTNHSPSSKLGVAPGLWPLGHSYKDKTARRSPGAFSQKLRAAYSVASDYVWIYGFGSSWQTAGPYGTGRAVENFGRYLNVLHDARKVCRPNLP